METKSSYRLYGHIGSPYSMKPRAALRYRRLPHVFVEDGRELSQRQSSMRVPVIPILEYPDGSLHNDSTPLFLDLEQRHPDARSIVPPRESDAFLAALIEDLADEWLAKPMYFYRWFHPEFRKQTSEWIAYDMHFGGGLERMQAWAEVFRERQAERLALVGCTPENRPAIEAIATRFLEVLEPHVVETPFLFGSRPSIADFGLFGQLSQFVVDLAVIEPARTQAPFTMRWVLLVHDLSGLEGSWRASDEPLRPAVEALLKIAGEDYLPFLVANAHAWEEKSPMVHHESSGLTYEQAPYRYQVKCLADLRQKFAALSAEARDEISPLLEQTGCAKHLRAQAPR